MRRRADKIEIQFAWIGGSAAAAVPQARRHPTAARLAVRIRTFRDTPCDGTKAESAPMLKALIFLLTPLATAGLVFVFGLPVLLACFALALGTFLLSTGEVDESNDIQGSLPVTQRS